MCMIERFEKSQSILYFWEKIYKHRSLLKMQVTKLRVKNVNIIRNKKKNK